MIKIFRIAQLLLEQFKYKNSKANDSLFKNIYKVYKKKNKKKKRIEQIFTRPCTFK